MTEPPLRSVLPGASVVTETSGVVLPTAPLNVVTPAVLVVRLKPPSTVEPKLMLPLPLPVEISVVSAPSATASP